MKSHRQIWMLLSNLDVIVEKNAEKKKCVGMDPARLRQLQIINQERFRNKIILSELSFGRQINYLRLLCCVFFSRIRNVQFLNRTDLDVLIQFSKIDVAV